ncbi:MAG: cytochrome c biogenesis protein CcsA [Spirochaetes bacterium]|nr:cytochrome c biogenesis protein CcsA [Spirochaetota bacterium]
MQYGTILIYISLFSSIALFVLLCFSVFNKKNYFDIAGKLFYASGASIVISSILLFFAFLTDRFDLSYVYNYSSFDLHTFYKISGFWAGQEGTFLLWALLLFVFGIIIIKKNDEYRDIVLSVISLTQVFILLILVRQSPFEAIWNVYKQLSPGQIPVDGSGLNPLLQDPWMIVHPPVLFIGYASASIPFAYAVAGLLKKQYREWAVKARPWVIFCMTTLGIGIFLGAYWAYKVLGWGGYWGWDPVENSSLIPWLTITALMHGLLLQKRKGVLIKTNMALAVISLVLVFYSTFLTRSGILSDFSVHSFSDLGLKAYLIIYILVFLLAGFILLAFRFRGITANPLEEKVLTGNNSINYGIIVLLVYTAFILIGTSMPIISGLFFAEASNVNTSFYNRISIPFGILILGILIIASAYRSGIKIKIAFFAFAVLSAAFSFLMNLFFTSNIAAYIFVALGFLIVFQNIADLIVMKSSVSGSRLAHLGIGIMVIGIITSNIHSYSVKQTFTKDIETDVDSITLTFKGLKTVRGIKAFESTAGEGITALSFLYKNNNSTAEEIATPYFISEKMNSLMREPYIDYGFFTDIYISPIEYKDSSEAAGNLIISKGEEKAINNLRIKFIDFEIDKTQMKSGNPKLFVNLLINVKGRNYKVSPGVKIKGNERETLDVTVPVIKRKISLSDFDIQNKKILLYLEPDKNVPAPSPAALMDISYKRMVWLVWLGTIMIALGGAVSIRKAVIKN